MMNAFTTNSPDLRKEPKMMNAFTLLWNSSSSSSLNCLLRPEMMNAFTRERAKKKSFYIHPSTVFTDRLNLFYLPRKWWMHSSSLKLVVVFELIAQPWPFTLHWNKFMKVGLAGVDDEQSGSPDLHSSLWSRSLFEVWNLKFEIFFCLGD